MLLTISLCFKFDSQLFICIYAILPYSKYYTQLIYIRLLCKCCLYIFPFELLVAN